MSSATCNLVFSSVVGTLSTTLLDQIPGDRHEFLTNLLSTHHVRIQDEPTDQTFSIIGLLEDIVSCNIKLSKFVLTASQQFGSDVKSFQKSQCCIEKDSTLAFIDSFDLKHENINAEKINTEVDHSRQTIHDNKSLLLCESKDSAATLGNEGKENDGSEIKIPSCFVYKYLLQNHGRRKRKKPRTAQTIDCKNEPEESQMTKIMTKRGRLVKRPTKLDSSVLFLDRKDESIGSPEVPNRKKFRQRKKFRLLEEPNQNQNNGKFGAVQGEMENRQIDKTNDSKDQRTDDVKLEQALPRNQGDHSYESSISISKDVKKQIRKHYEDRMPYKYFCTKCSFKSKRESHFNNHMQLHEKNPNLKLIKCDSCDYTCIRQSLLKKHQLCHESVVLQCETCKYKTNSQENLDAHILKVHKSQKVIYRKHPYKFKCSLCPFRTSNKANLMSHVSSHANVDSIQQFSCSECPYSTRKRVHFERHRKNVHSNRRPFLCDLCGAAFKRTDTLAAHKLTHVERSKRVLPFRCGLCAKAFGSKAHLLSHMSVHSTVRAFQCHICGQMFKTRQVQLKHQQNIHYNPRSFKCSVCNKEFNTKYTLQRHVRTHDTDLVLQANAKAMQDKQTTETLNGPTDESVDENMTAIQQITPSEFTPQLQTAPGQLQSGTDIGTIYVEGLETVVPESCAISIVNLQGQEVHQIFIPQKNQHVDTTINPNQYITQITATTTPSGISDMTKGNNSEVSDSDLGPMYVSTVSIPDCDVGLVDTEDVDGVYIQKDPGNHEIKQILVPSKLDSGLENGTIQLGEIILDQSGSLVKQGITEESPQ